MLTFSGTQANMATLHLSLAELQMNLERRDLRLVLAIGDAGTLLGGARALGIDHSTTFRRLNSLEERLALSYLTDVGLPTACSNHARLDVNGAYYGLFGNIEQSCSTNAKGAAVTQNYSLDGFGDALAAIDKACGMKR